MAASCAICGNERVCDSLWWACKECPDVRLDTTRGKVLATSSRWYCSKCVRVLASKKFLWIFSTPLCGHCGQGLRKDSKPNFG